MALPNPSAFDSTPLTVGTDDVSVTFQFNPLSGRRYFQILKGTGVGRHPITAGMEDADAISVTMMIEAIGSTYTSVESAPQPFTPEDAVGIWGCEADPNATPPREAQPGWEQWARTKITNTIVQRCTQGVDADPKAG